MFAVKVPPCFGSRCHINFLLTYKQMFSCLHDLVETKFTTSRYAVQAGIQMLT